MYFIRIVIHFSYTYNVHGEFGLINVNLFDIYIYYEFVHKVHTKN